MKRIKINFILTIVVLFYSFCTSNAQKEANYWYFGDKAALDFSSGNPVPALNSQSRSTPGCASISDKDGTLLFYTNGDSIWNRNHAEMPSYKGNFSGDIQISNNINIVAQPGSSSIYYVFFGSNYLYPSNSYGLRNDWLLGYSIVDMSLDGGMGDVVSVPNLNPISNILTSTTNGKFAIVKHANGCDFWIVSNKNNRNENNSDNHELYAFLLTSAGINTEPVITKDIGSSFMAMGSDLGQMKVSPNGSKVAISYVFRESGLSRGSKSVRICKIDLFDFNISTGIFSNAIFIEEPYVGMEFSPDNDKFYIWTLTNGILQYNLQSNYSSSILNSKTTISTFTMTLQQPIETYGAPYNTMQLSNNGKIYLSYWDATSLSAINNPNALGTACNFVPNTISLGGKISYHGLPSFPNNLFYSYSFVPIEDKTVCKDVVLDARRSPGLNYLWSTGEKTPKITANESGFYWVEVSGSVCTPFETIRDTATVVINNAVFAPSAFTPNNDGLNDLFNPTITDLTYYDLKIYDKWGHLIFSTTDSTIGWDGELNGQRLNNDVYAYTLDYKTSCTDDETLRKMGSITLIK